MSDRIHVPVAHPDDHRHTVTFAMAGQGLDDAAARALALAEIYFAPTRLPRLVASEARPVATAGGGTVVLDSEGRPGRWIVDLTYIGVLPPPERT